MKTLRDLGVGLAALAWWVSGAAAENWPQWRGPFLNGSTTETNLPTTFSRTKNVVWVADVPAGGGATPIVWGDRVFLSAMEPDSKSLWAMCLNRADGSVLWKRRIGTGFANKMGNTGASPSAITDGKTVWFYYGTGPLLAMDFQGKELWRRDIQADHGKFEVLWAYASTGLLHAGKLYIPVIHGSHKVMRRDVSYLLCVDPKTGKDLWKTPRITDGQGESQQAFITPLAHKTPAGWQILLTGGDHVTGHDAANGKMLWQSPSYNPSRNKWWRTVPSPVAVGNVAIGCAPKGGRLFGVRMVAEGDKPAGSEVWRSRRHSPDVCTPLIYQGALFVLDGRKKELIRVEPRTGKVVWKGELRGKAVFQASATGADGKIYCINLRGEAVVASAGKEFKVLHRVEMGGQGVRSTIVAAGGNLFLRAGGKLYCLGKRK